MVQLTRFLTQRGSPGTNIALFFIGVFALYASLTPGAIGGMGYNAEEMRAATEMVEALKGRLTGAEGPSGALQLCRNGYVTVVLDLPAQVLAGLLPGNTGYWREWTTAVQACLLAALLSTLLFAWLNEKLASTRLALFLSLLAAFATLYWPYAYIGLESKASLFLMLAAWFALERSHSSNWRTVLAFSLAAGLALSVKSNGPMLLPAVAFLVFRVLMGMRPANLLPREYLLRAATVVIVPLAFLAAGWATRVPFWNQYGGTMGFAAAWSPRDALAPLFHFVGLFGSPNKGLFVYVPAALLALWVMPMLWQRHRHHVTFALLTLLGVAAGSSLIRFWSDETWGPRYLHVATGPMLLCLGLYLDRQINLIWRAALVIAFVWGSYVAAVGSLFTYGSLHHAATRSGQSTLEALQGDVVWNHILFNGRLLKWWLNPGTPAVWTPVHQWFYEVPQDAKPWPALDLRPFSVPQSVLLREWGTAKEGLALLLWRLYAFSGLGGVLALSLLCVRIIPRPRAAEPAASRIQED
jgi:hypothetical protein